VTNNFGATLRMIGAIVTICGTLGVGIKYVGESIWNFAKVQTEMSQHIRGVEKAVSGLGDDQKNLKTGLAQEHNDAAKAASDAAEAARVAAQAAASTAHDLEEGRKINLPRIDRLEQVIPPIQNDLAGIKQHLQDIQELGQKNLDVSNSHTGPLTAVSKALAPTPRRPQD
jgi:hypothetical protein